MKVLVVEDDEFTRTLLTGAIASLGHECVAAVDGLHGWSHIQTSMPDVVISDWRMPGMDGLELCAKVREVDDAVPVYFVLLTAADDRHTAIEALDAGVDDYLLKPVDLDEVETQLLRAQRWLGLCRKVATRGDQVELLSVELRESAERDPLTKVYNRLRLAQDMAGVQDRANRYGHTYAVAIFDIDHFKAYNDTFGHVAGDEALIRVAGVITEHARAGDTVYRIGAAQFLLLLPEQHPDTARIAAERIRKAIARTTIRHEHLSTDGMVTVSVGVAGLCNGTGAFDDALGRADQALTEAKASGRNRTVVAPAGIEPDTKRA